MHRCMLYTACVASILVYSVAPDMLCRLLEVGQAVARAVRSAGALVSDRRFDLAASTNCLQVVWEKHRECIAAHAAARDAAYAHLFVALVIACLLAQGSHPSRVSRPKSLETTMHQPESAVV